MVDLILSDILVEVDRLKNGDFEFLSQKIVEIFPTEVATTYYIPPIPKRLSRGQKKSITSRGKLVDKYRNKLKEYRNLPGARIEKVSSTVDSENTIDCTSDEIQAAVNWLGKYTAPWEDVIEKWDLTKEFRRSDITSHSDKKVFAIYARWPILKHPIGHTLIKIDYDSLKLSVVENNLENWYTNVEKITQRKSDDSNKDALQDLFQLEDLSDDAKVVIQILLLPHLLPPKGRLRKNKKHWKPSISESKDSLIVHAVLPGDIIKIQQDRIEFMNGLGLSVQPFIIVVGPSLTQLSTRLEILIRHARSTIRSSDGKRRACLTKACLTIFSSGTYKECPTY